MGGGAPDITADAAIVVDENTGEVLYEKNPDKREYPASMTKIMTCLLAVENGNLQRIVEVSDRAADVECTRLRPGYRARMSTLLLQMMMIRTMDARQRSANRFLPVMFRTLRGL